MPICQYCKKWFEQNEYARRNKIQRFCSRDCMLKEYRLNGRFAEIVRCSQQKMKLKVLTHYGGNPPRCTCCGETIIGFLTIDHINGGGNQERKKIGYGGKFYYWLVQNNFPEGYQVLCMNCNFGKKCNKGICPHKS